MPAPQAKVIAAADEKGSPVRIARECVDASRQEHSRRKRKEHAARQVEDRADVGRSPCAWNDDLSRIDQP